MDDRETGKRQPTPKPTDAEVAAYVAETCEELERLCESPAFRTVRYMLGLVRFEAEKAARAAGNDHRR